MNLEPTKANLVAFGRFAQRNARRLALMLDASSAHPISGMGGIFINYRREDAAPWAGRLYERLAREFPRKQLLIDVDAIEPGLDFVRVLEELVSGCDVMLTIIGPSWVEARNKEGLRRLDDPKDFVRIELGSALERDIRVIPVLVDGAPMPRAEELPEPLKPLARRNAVRVSHERFGADTQGLVEVLQRLTHSVEPAFHKPDSTALRDAEETSLPENMLAELRRSMARLREQIQQLEHERLRLTWVLFLRRAPVTFASVFALASLPIRFAMRFLFHVLNTRVCEVGQSIRSVQMIFERERIGSDVCPVPEEWSWFGPSDEGDWGLFAGGVLVVVWALALMRLRGAEIRGTEVALYWLGLSLAVPCAMAGLFDGLNWSVFGPSVKPNVAGLFAGWMLAAISGVILLRLWRWRAARRPAR